MFIQHTAFLLDKGSQHRRRGILPPAVSISCSMCWILLYELIACLEWVHEFVVSRTKSMTLD